MPFESEYCTAKSVENKRERLEKLVISACKQCERSVPMLVEDCIKFDMLASILDKFRNEPDSIILFANEREGQEFDFSVLKDKKNIAIVVGSEGGFSSKEKDILSNMSESVSLGERILRAETASIVLCGMVSILGGN